MLAVLLAVGLAVGLAVLPLVAAQPARAQTTGGPVVLVGTAGLRWDDVSASTVAVTTLLTGGAVGSSVARSVEAAACPVDGWLAVSAGRRADDARTPSDALGSQGCRPPTATLQAAAGGAATVERWQEYRSRAAAGSAGAVPGTLGDALARAGTLTAAIGPGAAVALADGQGRVPHYWPGVAPTSHGGIDPDADLEGLATQLQEAFALGPALLVIDAGAIRDDPGTSASNDVPPSRDQQVQALDDPKGLSGRLGVVIAQLPDDATFYLASLADSGTRPHLQVVAAGGPRITPGLLTSGSTRQPGLVTTPDLTATLAQDVGVSLPQTDASPLRSTATDSSQIGRLQRVLDLDEASQAVQRLVTPFFAVALGLEALALLLLLWLSHETRLKPQLRRHVVTALTAVGVAGGALPLATYLAQAWPWWRSGAQAPVLFTAVGTFVVPVALLALLGPWRRHPLGPPAVVGAVTALVLTLDVAVGSPLSLVALIGGQPLVGGRYFGFSNPGFALFATGMLLAALAGAVALVARGQAGRAGLLVAGLGLVAAVVDVLPSLGADVGGPPAILPAFGYLALRAAGIRLTWRRALLVLAGTAALVTAILVADWLRPPDSRTHLGRFVQTVLDGGGGAVVTRKLEQNLGILVSTPLTLLVPVVAAVVVTALVAPRKVRLTWLDAAYARFPLLRSALAAWGILLLLGFAANDSGTAIPPVAAMLLLPLLVGVVARCAVLAEAESLEAEVAAVRAATRPKRR